MNVGQMPSSPVGPPAVMPATVSYSLLTFTITKWNMIILQVARKGHLDIDNVRNSKYWGKPRLRY